MTEPTDELRQAVARALCRVDGINPDHATHGTGSVSQSGVALWQVLRVAWQDKLPAADAAIAAYEAHRPRAAVVLTREEWDEAVRKSVSVWFLSYDDEMDPPEDEDNEFVLKEMIRAAFPFIRVEGE